MTTNIENTIEIIEAQLQAMSVALNSLKTELATKTPTKPTKATTASEGEKPKEENQELPWLNAEMIDDAFKARIQSLAKEGKTAKEILISVRKKFKVSKKIASEIEAMLA